MTMLSRKTLLDWLVAQPEASVTPDALLKKAIEVEGGKIEDALSLCWDVLSDDWYETDKRNFWDRSKKLVDITGELAHFDGNDQTGVSRGARGRGRSVNRSFNTIRGDNFSAWYHFFGTAYNSFYRTNREWIPGRGLAETHGLIFLEERVLYNDHIDDLKRVEIDKAGARFGHRLARNIRRYGDLEKFTTSPDYTGGPYLYSNPEKYGKKWRLQPGQLAKDFGTLKYSNHDGPTGRKKLATQAIRKLTPRF